MTAHPDPAALLRSKSYLSVLAISALLGAPISAAAYGFLALVSYLQSELFTHLPHGLGFTTTPAWWPAPVLLVGAVLVAVAITKLPGTGGPSPAAGFKLHQPPTAARSPGLVAAGLATLCFGMVLGPEMPLILLGGGLAALAIGLAKRDAPEEASRVVASAGSFAAISTLLGSPIIGAFLIMEATELGGAMLGVVLVPGLLAAGIGSLIFVGLDSLTGLGTFSLAIPGLPGFSRPNIGEFGWAIVIGLAAPLIGAGLRWMAPRVHPRRQLLGRRPDPAAGLQGPGLRDIAWLLPRRSCLSRDVHGRGRRHCTVAPAGTASGRRGSHWHRRHERGHAHAAADIRLARNLAARVRWAHRHAARYRRGHRRPCRQRLDHSAARAC